MGKQSSSVGCAVPNGVKLKGIDNTGGKYFAGSDGEIYCYSNSRRASRLPKPFRLTKQCSENYPYPSVAFILNSKRVTKSLHVLVCTAFHGDKPSAIHEVRHLDGKPENGKPENLAWGTPAQNEADKRLHGTAAIGEKHGAAKLNDEAVRILRASIPFGLWNPVDAAKVFGVSESVLRDAVRGRTWRHI